MIVTNFFIEHQKLMDIHQVTLNNEHMKTIFSIREFKFISS